MSHELVFVQAHGSVTQGTDQISAFQARRPSASGHSVMNGQGQLRATLNIRERPAEANDRAVPGHWEGDLLMGKRMPRDGDPRGTPESLRDVGRVAERSHG